jgi:hypothetical protein
MEHEHQKKVKSMKYSVEQVEHMLGGSLPNIEQLVEGKMMMQFAWRDIENGIDLFESEGRLLYPHINGEIFRKVSIDMDTRKIYSIDESLIKSPWHYFDRVEPQHDHDLGFGAFRQS